MLRSVRSLVLFGLLMCMPLAVQARQHFLQDADLPDISQYQLPPEARTTMRLIKQGGPFPYPRDGVVFGNYEHRLPPQPRGYYREYTVPTPGVRNRGARRIICGPLPDGNTGKGGERDEAQGARSGMTETHHEGRRESEHRATQRFARAATLMGFPECYYSADHYRTFLRIRE